MPNILSLKSTKEIKISKNNVEIRRKEAFLFCEKIRVKFDENWVEIVLNKVKIGSN